MSNGRCGHGEEFPAECSDGGGKKQSHPAEGVADSLDEAQGETSPSFVSIDNNSLGPI